MNRHIKLTTFALAATFLGGAVGLVPARANVVARSGVLGGVWAPGGNWSGGSPPAPGDTAQFGFAGDFVDVNGSQQVTTLLYTAPSGFCGLNNSIPGSLTISSSVDQNSPGTFDFYTPVAFGSAITLQGNGLGTVFFDGDLLGSPAVTVTGGKFELWASQVQGVSWTPTTLNVTGGFLRLGSSNSWNFSGAATISGGTVCCYGAGPPNPSTISAASWTVNGGTLQGNGLVIGNVTVASGYLNAGCSGGKLDVHGDVSYGSAAHAVFELGNTVGLDDLITVTGNLTLNGTIDLVDLGHLTPSSYLLFTYTDTLVNNGVHIGSVPSGLAAQLDFSSPHQVRVVVVSTQPTNYSVLIPAGLTAIANQLDQLTNTVADIFATNGMDGCVISVFDNTNNSWRQSRYVVELGWDPPEVVLNPGEGGFLLSPRSLTLTFRGRPHVPMLPINIPSGRAYFLSRQNPASATPEDIVGADLPPNAVAFTYHNGFTAYTFDDIDLVWYPSTPVAATGEAMWIAPSGGSPSLPPPLIMCPSNKTVECGTTWSFDTPTAYGACSTNVMLTILTTLTNGNCPTTITRTWRATDSCGLSTSCSQTVTVLDTSPPIFTCASNKTVVGCSTIANTPDYAVLKSFATNGMDGFSPQTRLIEAMDGCLYGTTPEGGSHGTGTVYKLNKDGSAYATLLNGWTNGMDGLSTQAPLIVGSDGALYGTTFAGGTNGSGAVFKLQRDGTGFTVLRAFLTNGMDGIQPAGALIEASDGALYGATALGGTNGHGTVFKLQKDGTGYTVLRAFLTNGMDGEYAQAGVIEASDGALYGTTRLGGSNGLGTVFKMQKDGSSYTVLRHFTGTGGDGSQPTGLIEASDGCLYGTTLDAPTNGTGTVFKLRKDGMGYIILRTLTQVDGAGLEAGLIEAMDGCLYCTASAGGTNGSGTVFRLQKDGTSFTVLRSFLTNGMDGIHPVGLIEASDGCLYGATQGGGADNAGTVFKLRPPFLWSFDPPTASDACCGTNVTITELSTLTNGICPQTITRIWLATDCCGNTATCSQTVTLTDPAFPAIVVQPQSLSVTQGGTAIFTVKATGLLPLNYQWRNYNVVCPAANDVCVITNAQPSDAGSYTVIVSNSVGSVTSAPAILTVLPTTNCCNNCFPPYPFSRTVTVNQGPNFLYNPLCHGTDNTVGTLLPNVPDGTVLAKWNPAANDYGPVISFDSGAAGWLDSNFNDASGVVLQPREGFVLNNSGASFTITWSGCMSACPLPCLPTNNTVLVGGNTLGDAFWTNLSICPPICGTRVSVFNGVGFVNYDYIAGAWIPHPPLVPAGHSAFVSLITVPTTIVCGNNKSVPCNSPWSFDNPSVTSCCTNWTVTIVSTFTNSVGCSNLITRTWQVTDCNSNTTTCSQTIAVPRSTPPTFAGSGLGPNLVLNPDFENHTGCPSGFSQINLLTDWFSPTAATPDFYHVCSPIFMGVPNNVMGNQPAQSGSGYTGWYTYNGPYREYVETALTTPLVAGQIYQVSFYVSLSENSGSAVDNIGAHLSVGQVTDPGSYIMPVIPQVRNPANSVLSSKTAWMLISGTFTAAGGEDHISIGNFYDDNNTTLTPVAGGTSSASYYYLDSVSVAAVTGGCGQSNIVECGTPWSFQQPVATDACCSNVTVTLLSSNVISFTSPCQYVVQAVWQAMDCCSNSTTCTQTVTVMDTTPPVIQCPKNITVYTCSNSARVFYSVKIHDDCWPGPFGLIINPASGSTFNAGTTTTVNVSASDGCGNIANSSFTVTVVAVGMWQWFDQGRPDCYTGSYEVASRGPCLNSAYSSAIWKNFDDPTVDRVFGCSWTLPNAFFGDGWLYTRMRDVDCLGGSSNDSIYLGLQKCTSPTWTWSRSLGPNGPDPGLQPLQWCGLSGCEHLFSLHLNSLPLAAGGTTSVLPGINSNLRFDMLVQDDTMVDFAWLKLLRCPPQHIIGGFGTIITNAQLIYGPDIWTLAKDPGTNTGFAATFNLGAAAGAQFNFDGLSLDGVTNGGLKLFAGPDMQDDTALLMTVNDNPDGGASLRLGRPLPEGTNVIVQTLSNGVLIASQTVPNVAGTAIIIAPGSITGDKLLTEMGVDSQGTLSVELASGTEAARSFWRARVIMERFIANPPPLGQITLSADGFDQISVEKFLVGFLTVPDSIGINTTPSPLVSVSGDTLAQAGQGQVTLSALDATGANGMGIHSSLSSPTNEFRAGISTSIGLISPPSSGTTLSLGTEFLNGGGGDDTLFVDFVHNGSNWNASVRFVFKVIPMRLFQVWSNGTNVASVTNVTSVQVGGLPQAHWPSITWFVQDVICNRFPYNSPVAMQVNGQSYVGDELRVFAGEDGMAPQSLTGLEVDTTNAEALVLSSFETPPYDTDGDGMTDDWELAHGLNPNDPSDANADPDGDGMTNLQEFIAGTDPHNPADVFKLEPVVFNGSSLRVRFKVIPMRLYEIESTSSLGGPWQTAAALPAQSAARTVEVEVPNENAQMRFFRCRVIMMR